MRKYMGSKEETYSDQAQEYVNKQGWDEEKYWELVEAIPKIMPLGKSPGVKIDIRGAAEYVNRLGNKFPSMSQ